MPILSQGSIKVRQWIEDVLNGIVREVAKGEHGDACVVFRRVQKYEAKVKPHVTSAPFSAKDHEVKYSWPGKTADEAWRFGQVHLGHAGSN